VHVAWRRVDAPLDPVAACAALQGRSHVALLHSGMQVGAYGDYSFLAADPFLVLRASGRCVTLSGVRSEALDADPFEVLDAVLGEQGGLAHGAPVPFVGGAIGYLAYDLGRVLEPLPSVAEEDPGCPELYLAFYDAVLGFCHRTGEVYACGLGASGVAEAEARADALLAASRGPAAGREPGPASDGVLEGNFTREEYLAALRRTVEYIYAGDIFQANLSQRFRTRLRVSPWELYRRLHERNPAPFSAYLGFEGIQVVSASPERFLRVAEGRVETRPIKGTRPRGATPGQDEALARELLESEKDGAELTMIVDLERNDLGRVCRFGSVRVPELTVLESHPTVHHLVATVVGELCPGKSNADLLRASFPGGSITGAPKIRAMEIIEELEPTRRGVYTGCIGYLGYDGTMDLNIAIRTIAVRKGVASFQVGGGIVADSVPELEYRETLDKGRALAAALDAPLPREEDTEVGREGEGSGQECPSHGKNAPPTAGMPLPQG